MRAAVRLSLGSNYDGSVGPAVRGLLSDASAAGAGANPFASLVEPGGQVFLLANFVYHRRPQESREAFEAKCTQAAVLRPLVELAAQAVGPSGRVLVGNAPLQSCDWARVMADTGTAAMVDECRRRGLPVETRDLRLVVAPRDALGRTREVERRDASARAVEIDLGADSLLAELDAAAPAFRVRDYDPRRTEDYHRAGRHRYVIHRDILESQLIVSVPKLKTHEKVGITCALKGCVGVVGHKDCLAHHRFGGSARGGDEFPGGSSLREAVGRFHDWVQTRAVGSGGRRAGEVVDRNLGRVMKRLGAVAAGSWHGNDTAWRMTLDLARLVACADASGRVHDAPVRRHVALIDGIVAGEGEGPLAPSPVRAGTLIFAPDPVLADRIACRVMGFDERRIPMLREVARVDAIRNDHTDTVVYEGRTTSVDALPLAAGRPFAPPRGWRAHVEARR